jgi:hypothetical protein
MVWYLVAKNKSWEIRRARPKGGERLIGTFKDKKSVMYFTMFMVNYGYESDEVEKAYRDWIEIKKQIAKKFLGKELNE